ncbi:hypothetical protein LEP1GSC133_4600 [Leptospira borgpetersenii serovar Pomona str. 200901868]|uniref:Uncharacterized protein n=1 Tax=Leptospira borgpetersenii serovar Pomona str. 200901868 TaxID=1192866 RepID=M6WPK8_LEPBO|nr:hypothetical protein LEP1GSC133_4600 [Leptospira borgpetersenii serovar Pomona str. 200901868]
MCRFLRIISAGFGTRCKFLSKAIQILSNILSFPKPPSRYSISSFL